MADAVVPPTPGNPASSSTIPSFPDPIPKYLPYGTICTLSAASGTGKTRMLATWLTRLRDGKSICGHGTNRPTGIGILALDRRWGQYQELFDLIGWGDIPHFSFRDMKGFDWKKLKSAEGRSGAFNYGLDQLKLPPGSLVMVDPLSVFVTNQLMDYCEVAIGMSALDATLRRRQLTCLGTFHTHKVYANPKDRTLRPQDRILGSGAQLAFTDTSMYLASPAETGEDYFELGMVPHNAPEEQHHFVRDSNGLFIPHRDLAGKTAEERAMEVLKLIPLEGIETVALVDLAVENFAIATRTAYNHLKRLRTIDLVRFDEPTGMNYRVVTN